ncbi:plastocyanin/azurin family copper-binding protein [Enterovibrio sp. ZSDZ35]|uniref:Plastocyanin/azurin family copper-binding protein n=1 Tax=Enterovibrio qingdaonensis TaxID=2899818 RepID=A0ABT5QKR9_9GAMM|nr:plastocyanin/azurin family copper-binding protein [Enterovibrio sp. ZSDZ35]MDD1781587.1 plastocyanin/azurin family copper-binding protein [Enterovibrio sp. ZSDZ35]
MYKRIFLSFCLFWGLIGQSIAEEEHEIRAVGVKFDPMFVVIEPGDRVSWTNMPAHLIETIDVMVPEGTEKIKTELGVDVSFIFDNEGVYVYKCTPHWGARMGGILLVGNPDDIGGIIDAYFEEIQKDKSLLPAKGLLKKFRKHLQKEGLL